ncbi:MULTISPECIES: DnaB-like helicase C-terminal domain-containing protein [unclassified Azospirillum]|uniref:DnaB-like helicase C-terminal domain-containing protein n=1 Tax=unclassified Azospirillum TaxID=2630922 RepID=UPI000B71C091|nr:MULTISPECIES: DnaB-like helicase C-terminal domain-containing protein [unclassified Azospirillum]SNS84121.1 Replicative DNA helicase [Azospirillum sp. RU38E]SNT01417.1 Replicative DNA helicase [Azospirillum sp. RU37A]
MNGAVTLGRKLLASIASQGRIADVVGWGDLSYLFSGGEAAIYRFIRDHARKFGTLPTRDTIQAHTGESLPDHVPETPAYWLERKTQHFVETSLKRIVEETGQKFLTGPGKDPLKALDHLLAEAMALSVRRHTGNLFDFRDALNLILPNYVKAARGEEKHGILMGWPTLDGMTNGLLPGDLVSYVGRPAAGKTFQLLFSAHYAWWVQHKRVLFVSMEMATPVIVERLSAMHSQVGLTPLSQGALTSAGVGRLKQGLVAVKGADQPFWILDGNLTSTVQDIILYARQLAAECIYIDGAYLLKHPTERDRYRRVAENADLIKSELTPIGPVTASWQFKRSENRRQKQKEGYDLDDIAYADAIGQLSSLVLGLFQEESVETLNQRRVSILKGRKGEVGEFNILWDFQRMNFQEVEPQIPVDLRFV